MRRRLGDVPPELVEQRDSVLSPRRGSDSGQERRERRGCAVAAAVSGNCGERENRLDLCLGQRSGSDTLREAPRSPQPGRLSRGEVTGKPR